MLSDASGAGLAAGLGLVLALAGVAKLRDGARAVRSARELGVGRPEEAIRVLAALELACGPLAVVAPTRVSGAAIGVLFLGFAVLAWRLRQADADCGCFGAAGHGAAGVRRVGLNVAGAVTGLALSAAGPPAVLALAQQQRAGAAVQAVAIAGVVSVGTRRLFAGGGNPGGVVELVHSSASYLEQRISRRSALVRLTVAGSAFCVAPLRYLLYPEPAMAVIAPGSCGSGLCSDGYTAFCCEINRGLNECPAGTFAGGWWMCTDYPGNSLCSEEGVRYYVDCNRIPGRQIAGGCHCAKGSCAHRRVNCNVFRYGQCNTHVAGVTEVVCRVVTCTNPSLIRSFNCGSHLAVDNAVCGQEAACLGSTAIQLAGAGGV
jgi:hypothetical protein